MHFYLQSDKNMKILKDRITYTFNYGHDPEELFQDVCLYLLENPNLTATLQQIVVSVLRGKYGRKDGPNYDIRKALLKPVSANGLKHEDGTEMEMDAAFRALMQDPAGFSYSIEDRLEAKMELERIWPRLSQKHRDLIKEMYFLGRTGKEIGDQRGVTESMISVDRHRMLDKLREMYG